MNPERLLGALLKQGLRSGRRGRRRRRRSSMLGGLVPGGLTGAAGLGLLGVAVAAFEHFSQKGQATTQPPLPGGATPPPPPPGSQAGPPPPPAGPPPVPEAVADSGQSQRYEGAILLVRAMIAAANADGQIDPQERGAILEKLDKAGLGSEERRFLEQQLDHPPSLDDLVAQVNSPELAQQVYAASLLAIEVDTPAEQAYLNLLQARLDLDDSTVQQLNQQFGSLA